MSLIICIPKKIVQAAIIWRARFQRHLSLFFNWTRALLFDEYKKRIKVGNLLNLLQFTQILLSRASLRWEQTTHTVSLLYSLFQSIAQWKDKMNILYLSVNPCKISRIKKSRTNLVKISMICLGKTLRKLLSKVIRKKHITNIICKIAVCLFISKIATQHPKKINNIK